MSSNDLKQVRDYINSRMSVVSPDLIEWKDSLEDIGNIPKAILDRTYHITLGTISTSNNIAAYFEDSFTTTITIFKRAFNEPVESRDELLQVANCIRLDIINPLNVEAYKASNDGNIEDVQAASLTPSEINETNDNIIKVEVELNVRLFFAIT